VLFGDDKNPDTWLDAFCPQVAVFKRSWCQYEAPVLAQRKPTVSYRAVRSLKRQ
jgi:hypothetical protein